MTKSNRSCKMYPEMDKLTDAGLTHAMCTVGQCLKWERSHPRFQGPHTYSDYVEAMVCLMLEDEYRWENGGKAAFEATLKKTFGDAAIVK